MARSRNRSAFAGPALGRPHRHWPRCVAAFLAVARRSPLPLLVALSACAWLVLAATPHALIAPHIMCGADATGSAPLALAIFFARPPIGAWWLMLVAMMLPLLARPLAQIWMRSVAGRRWWSIVCFLAAYAMTWTAAGALLLPLSIVLHARVGSNAALVLAFIIACAWRATPAWQACHDRCHDVPRLAAFGLVADSLAYGANTAIWCIGTCWALMLLPLVAGRAHLTVMIGAALVAFIDRQRRPRPLRRLARPRGGPASAAFGTTRVATPTPSR